MCARHGVEPYLPLDSGREKVSRARGCEAPHPRSPPGPSHARSRARAGTVGLGRFRRAARLNAARRKHGTEACSRSELGYSVSQSETLVTCVSAAIRLPICQKLSLILHSCTHITIYFYWDGAAGPTHFN